MCCVLSSLNLAGSTLQKAWLVQKKFNLLLVFALIHYNHYTIANQLSLLYSSIKDEAINLNVVYNNMTTPFVFTFNIRRSLFEQLGNSLFSHLTQLRLHSGKILLLPVVNQLSDGVYTRAESIHRLLPPLLQAHGASKCHLISYSLSGIDARYALSALRTSAYASTLTTIATPHRGSRLAWLAERQVIPDKQAQPIARLLGVGLRPFWEMSPENLRFFNQRVPDAPSVKYFSIGAERLPNNMCLHLQETGNYMRQRSEANFVYENDGVVGHDECQWGEHLVNFEADHTEIVGINPYPQLQSVFTLIEDNVSHLEQEASA